MGLNCCCKWDVNGNLIDMCGSHAAAARRASDTAVEFAVEKLKEQHIQEMVRKDAIIDALLEKIARLK